MHQLATYESSAGFGVLLRQWRNLRRLSQFDLSLETQVSQRHLSFLESGRSQPSRAMVVQLSEALDVRSSHWAGTPGSSRNSAMNARIASLRVAAASRYMRCSSSGATSSKLRMKGRAPRG